MFPSIRARDISFDDEDDDNNNANAASAAAAQLGNEPNDYGEARDHEDENEDEEEDEDEGGDPRVVQRGLKSRKRWSEAKRIVDSNDLERRTGMQSRYVSSSVLQLMSGRMTQLAGLPERADENCLVM